VVVLVALAAACSDRVEGLEPVGGAEDSLVRKERFVRRLHLDLTAAAPAEADTAAALDRLAAEGNSAATRGALAGDLIETPAFASAYVAELENRIFAGQPPEYRYQLLCNLFRNDDPACQACPDPVGGDPCSGCDCPMVALLAAERTALADSATDLASGMTTGEIELRYAMANVFRYYGNPQAVSQALFLGFLGRLPGSEELRNAMMMVFGAGTGQNSNPNGVLFHRYGKNYQDLGDIVFTSEVYREAVVDAVFLRYLGRNAAPAELAHFAAQLDAEAPPDARPLIRAVLSSREYFEQ
jgi:hypothetical protein